VAVAEPESVNLGLVVGSQRALLVDTGSSPTQGRVLRASIAAVTDMPVTAVDERTVDRLLGLVVEAAAAVRSHAAGGRPD